MYFYSDGKQSSKMNLAKIVFLLVLLASGEAANGEMLHLIKVTEKYSCCLAFSYLYKLFVCF